MRHGLIKSPFLRHIIPGYPQNGKPVAKFIVPLPCLDKHNCCGLPNCVFARLPDICALVVHHGSRMG